MKILLHPLKVSFVSYLFHATFVDGFSGNTLPTARSSTTGVVSMTNNDSEEPSDSANSKGTRRGAGSVRRRCVDYPKYAYDAGTKEVKVLTSTGLKDGSLNAEAMRTRLLEDRSYARSEPFLMDNMMNPPTLADLSPPKEAFRDKFFISTPANVLSFLVSYLLFPPIIHVMEFVINTSGPQLEEILTTYAPGVSILYGTFVSLTLSILYNRQRTIQDNVAMETSLLSVITRSLISLLREDECKLIEAGQCAADQIRTLVKTSRGEELMLLMYNDPYARMMEIIDLYESQQGDEVKQRALISYSRDTIRELIKYRSKRLSDESLALPPTHFFILNSLTLLILLSYTVSVLATLEANGDPSNTSSILFGSLASTYFLFYNFAKDLNNPFQGVYQVRY
ncbi:hypothetical protein FisN_11Hh111 [Fistulifera solaris]|uniref:Uncharacterized protein n=1 Tax=Fistulifera solaris TaxID=1519565 RepID=A0A1Z5JK87_FISSO|nr:hypothetical protein FisN_11Hh111 [Fistulifera solaris]|eukprot:GAX14430.1 hypothetical protein FisN_11Hh111 [Fistulifera solaris]